MIRFLHAADIHLDSPLLGLGNYEGLPVAEIRRATRDAFDNLVSLAIERQVDFLLIAGDLYDGDWRDARTGMFFVSRMSRLREHGIPVFLVHGNHDAASQITRSLPRPGNVHVFGSLKASHQRIDALQVAIHGQSYAHRDNQDNLAAAYPARIPGCFNIGLLHTSLGGYSEHASYAPCSLDDLRARQYDYWALGHVHAAQILSTEPYIVFPGNVQGRHIGERGEKGCFLVTVGDNLRVASYEFVALDTFRWRLLDVDLSGVSGKAEMHARVADALRSCDTAGRMIIARVELSGRTPLHQSLLDSEGWKDDIRALALDLGRERLWIEKILLNTSPPAVAPPSPIPIVVPPLEASLFQPFLQKLPDDLRREVESWLVPGAQPAARLVDDALSLLRARLSASGDRDAH